MITRFIVLGCGHTGTTLISGIMHRTGFWGCDVGEHFEPLALTAINKKIKAGQGDKKEIESFFCGLERQSKGVWTLKDPRNSDTIFDLFTHMNEPFGIIFNFRHPANTIRHLMIHDCDGALNDEEKKRFCEDQYIRRNRTSLDFIKQHPEIPVLFIHYDDLVDRKLDHVISRFVGKKADLNFINLAKRRSQPIKICEEANILYDEIMHLYRENIVKILINSPAVFSNNPVKKKISYIRFFLKKIIWRLKDRVNQKSVLWRIKLTLMKKYGWEYYSK